MTSYEALRTSAAWIDLSARGKIRVTGEDRARLVHAMSTNDVKNLPAGEGVYAFFLTDKGRILTDAYIYNCGESLLLDTEPETAGKLRDHLDRYIIADDATLEEETGEWAETAIEGPESLTLAKQAGIPVPNKRYSIENWGSGLVTRVGSTGPEGLRVFLRRKDSEEFVQRLASLHIPNANTEECRIVRLENGVPRYGEDISERYLVQETQAVHAVHSNKGCYLGQEIVERVRSRGQVHRVLTPIHVSGNVAPAPGTKLSADGKDVAEITSAAYSPALAEVVALAYVRTEAAHAKPEMVVAGAEPPVRAYIV
ncbi:MAG: folate-binding protein YgfZ [Acidobacteriaceae bacterium]|nr:folate-binding protein YgfZ [Acidobacteriaceae bacterium]MBV9765303.1 folate-binding protein YgfZ [Acidobacteriaceae bacterium]